MIDSVFNNERHLWTSSLKILEGEYPEDEKYPALIKVVENGYDYFYEDVKIVVGSFQDVSQWPKLKTGVGEETCEFVVYVLGVYLELYCAQSKHGKEKIPDDLIGFRGFDLETENKHFHFCCFMLENASQIYPVMVYENIKNNPHFRRNYHGGIVPYYKGMLERYENTSQCKLFKCGVPSYLSPDDVRRVIG